MQYANYTLIFRYAAEYGIIVVCPDTSPRKVNLPGEDDAYDFGSGAGFYVDGEFSFISFRFPF